MPNGRVTHAEQDGVHVLRYSGKVDYMSAPAIQTFVEHLIERGHVSGLVFDLTDAEGLDSTNLGLLARVNERVHERGGGESVIVSSNDDINGVLYSMGFDQIFDIVSSGAVVPRDGDATIEPVTPSQEELRCTMLEAHRALVRLSETGRVQFEEVVACLENERKERTNGSR